MLSKESFLQITVSEGSLVDIILQTLSVSFKDVLDESTSRSELSVCFKSMSVKMYLIDVRFSTWFRIFSSKSLLLIGVVELSDRREVEFLNLALIFSLDTSSGMGNDMMLLEFVLFTFAMLLLLPDPDETKLLPSSFVVFDLRLDLNFFSEEYDVLCFKLIDRLDEDRLLFMDMRRSPPVDVFAVEIEFSLENSDLWKSLNDVLLRIVGIEEVGELGPLEEAMDAFLLWLIVSEECPDIMLTFSDCVETDFGNSEDDDDGDEDFFQNFHFPESELAEPLVAVVFVAVVDCEYIEFLCDENCIDRLFLSCELCVWLWWLADVCTLTGFKGARKAEEDEEVLAVRALAEGIIIDLLFCFGSGTLITGTFSLFALGTSLSLMDILLNSCLSEAPVDDRFMDDERELLLLGMLSSDKSCDVLPEC